MSCLIKKHTKMQSVHSLELLPFHTGHASQQISRSLIRAHVFSAEITNVTELRDNIIKAKLQDISGSSHSVSVEVSL